MARCRFLYGRSPAGNDDHILRAIVKSQNKQLFVGMTLLVWRGLEPLTWAPLGVFARFSKVQSAVKAGELAGVVGQALRRLPVQLEDV